MFFLSALDVSASPASFETLSHVKACVNISLSDALVEQSEDCNDHLDLSVSSLVHLTDNIFYPHPLTKRVFQFTFCNRSRACTYLTLKVLRI